MRKRFVVVIPNDSGGEAVFPMKQWVREHMQSEDLAIDLEHSTSHQMRLALRRAGWTDTDTGTEIRLVEPGTIDPLGLAVIEASDNEAGDDDLGQSFALEFQLRDFLAQNLETIKVGGTRLVLYTDSKGRDGVEYPTDVGPVDILAVDALGNFVVLELKRSRSPDHAIGQLSRYMGWVKNKMDKTKSVRGVIVAKSITDNLRYAASVIPNVDLYEYQVKFELKHRTDFETVLATAANSASQDKH
jgi:hypothetical protein